MTLELYYHPFSSYCQKVLVALDEKGLPWQGHLLNGTEPTWTAFGELWPIRKFPLLVHEGRTIFEATAIIEYLEARFPESPRLIPADPLAAIDVRMWERFFDNYIAYPQFRLLAPRFGQEATGDDAKWDARMDTALGVLDARMAGREWVAATTFSMADCAAAPHLLYAHWTRRIPERFGNVLSYRARLLARPSYARALDAARPHRIGVPMEIPEGE